MIIQYAAGMSANGAALLGNPWGWATQGQEDDRLLYCLDGAHCSRILVLVGYHYLAEEDYLLVPNTRG